MTFALLREGTSDDHLIEHIAELLLEAGVERALGTPRYRRGPVRQQLEEVLAEETPVDLIFVHKDSDSPDAQEVLELINEAAAGLLCNERTVPIVPVQELEAWLLVDEQAIREVVGKPRGRVPLNLPKPSKVEKTSSPKEVLKEACVLASETTGARRKRQNAQFEQQRNTLVDRLDRRGPVTQLASWNRFVDDLSAAVRVLLANARVNEGETD